MNSDNNIFTFAGKTLVPWLIAGLMASASIIIAISSAYMSLQVNTFNNNIKLMRSDNERIEGKIDSNVKTTNDIKVSIASIKEAYVTNDELSKQLEPLRNQLTEHNDSIMCLKFSDGVKCR